LIQGEWRVTPDFSVVAVRDESGVFSLIFRLHRRYH
jgi:translocation and assembly module TamB